MAYDNNIEIVICKTPIEIWSGWEEIHPSDESLRIIGGKKVVRYGVLDDEGNTYHRFEQKALRVLPGMLVPVQREKAKGLLNEEKEGDPQLRVTGFASQVIELNLSEMREYNEKQKALALKLKPLGQHLLNLKYIRSKT